MQPDPHDEPHETNEGLLQLPELEGRILPGEAGLHHHLLAVMRPALHERGRREEQGFAHLRLDLPEVLVLQEVPRTYLVHRDGPERGVVEIAQVLFLAVGGPRAIDVGDVVVGPRWLGLEWAGGPHARPGPAVEIRRRCDEHRLAVRDAHELVALHELREVRDLLLRGLRELARRGMIRLEAAPRVDRIRAVHSARNASELLLGLTELAQRDGQQAVGSEGDPLVQLQFLLELLAPEPERSAGLGGLLPFQVVDVALNRRCGFRGGIGQITEQVEIIDGAERPREVAFDEREGTLQRFNADFHEDAGWVLDVVARRLDEAARLTQFREHAPGPLGDRRIREQRLHRQARGEDVAVELGVALPGADLLGLEHAGLDVSRHDRVLDPLDRREPVVPDVVQPPREARQRARVGLDRRPPEILEQVVVRVHAVKRGDGGVDFL